MSRSSAPARRGRTEARALDEPPECDPDHDRHAHDEQAIGRVAYRPEIHQPLQRLGRLGAAVGWPPDHGRDLLHDQGQPDCADDLERRIYVVEAPDQQRFHRKSDQADRQGRHDQCDPKAHAVLEQGPAQESSQHEERTVGEVDEVAYPEDQRQAHS